MIGQIGPIAGRFWEVMSMIRLR